jgi:hypothetical protein
LPIPVLSRPQRSPADDAKSRPERAQTLDATFGTLRSAQTRQVPGLARVVILAAATGALVATLALLFAYALFARGR